MALPSIFTTPVAQQLANRINKLTPATQPVWGKMNVAQMLAHCNVTYELAYENIHPRPNTFMRFILRNFIKKIVVSEKPYAHNTRTAPVFLMTSEKDFSREKERLLNYIVKTQQLGAAHFEGKENHGFGKLSSVEWNNMFYKHLNHHLEQFGV
jgi:SRSO17 transposase